MAIPDLNDVMLYLEGDGGTSWPEDEVSSAYDAELAAQRNVVRARYFETEAEDYREYPDDLAEALKRRVARNLAARGVPLAVQQGDDGTVPLFVPRLDPEIRRYEAPYRRMPVG